eukprot:6474076-Amphidinium_carterae.1
MVCGLPHGTSHVAAVLLSEIPPIEVSAQKRAYRLALTLLADPHFSHMHSSIVNGAELKKAKWGAGFMPVVAPHLHQYQAQCAVRSPPGTLPFTSVLVRCPHTRTSPAEERLAWARSKLSDLGTPQTTFLYVDGGFSQTEGEPTGLATGGAMLESNASCAWTCQYLHGVSTSSTTSELLTLLAAVRDIRSLELQAHLVIVMDSLAALKAVLGRAKTVSALVKEIRDALSTLGISRLTLLHVHSHIGVEGNELVDRLA